MQYMNNSRESDIKIKCIMIVLLIVIQILINMNPIASIQICNVYPPQNGLS